MLNYKFYCYGHQSCMVKKWPYKYGFKSYWIWKKVFISDTCILTTWNSKLHSRHIKIYRNIQKYCYILVNCNYYFVFEIAILIQNIWLTSLTRMNICWDDTKFIPSVGHNIHISVKFVNRLCWGFIHCYSKWKKSKLYIIL